MFEGISQILKANADVYPFILEKTAVYIAWASVIASVGFSSCVSLFVLLLSASSYPLAFQALGPRCIRLWKEAPPDAASICDLLPRLLSCNGGNRCPWLLAF